MRRTWWVTGCGLMLSAGLGAFGCNDIPVAPIRVGAAGADGGGAGGQTGTGGDAGAASSGGAPDGGRCKELDACPESPCPTIESLRAQCAYGDVVQYRSSCGGVLVQTTADFDDATWSFDATGRAIGSYREGEGTCEYWGERCSAVGTAESLCDEPGECTTHDSCDTWGANFGCPASPEEAASYCSFTANEVQRFASACGGTVITANNGVQAVAYTFDDQDELVGVSSLGDVGDCDQWGEQCEAVGEATPLCGEGGQGGSGGEAGGGAGGQGGNAP